jgi:hypothetical protein
MRALDIIAYCDSAPSANPGLDELGDFLRFRLGGGVTIGADDDRLANGFSSKSSRS